MNEEQTHQKEIQELTVDEMIQHIREDTDSGFAVFLSIELLERFKDRTIEEKHMSFDQWSKLLMLREDNIDEIKVKEALVKHEAMQKWREKENQRKTGIIYKDVVIPESLKTASTKYLLSLRYGPYNEWTPDVSRDQIYAELANRPHIPNKAEKKAARREASKRKT